jgi:hypothetical protein
MPKADYIILVSPEGPSEYFSALSEETGVQLIVVDKAERIIDALDLYSQWVDLDVTLET